MALALLVGECEGVLQGPLFHARMAEHWRSSETAIRGTTMQVKAVGTRYLVRLEPGEDAIESLKRFADSTRIAFAAVRAIGTFERVTLGYYDLDTQTYQTQEFDEPVEVLNLTGNIARGEDDERMVHAHVTVGRPDYSTLGGHLVEAVVGPTLEVVIEPGPVTVRRRHDDETGLALWDLEAVETFSI